MNKENTIKPLSRDEMSKLLEEFPVGTRVELVKMDDEFSQLLPGDKGVVRCIDSIGTVHINWDNGSSLGIVYGVDKCKKIECKMDVKIYQIVLELDRNHFAFSNLDYFIKSGEIPAEIYETVFSGKLDVKSPEDVFIVFNTVYHEKFKGRSLSVSDIVEFQYSPTKSVFYFCDSIGFKKIKFNKEKSFLLADDIAKIIETELDKHQNSKSSKFSILESIDSVKDLMANYKSRLKHVMQTIVKTTENVMLLLNYEENDDYFQLVLEDDETEIDAIIVSEATIEGVYNKFIIKMMEDK